MNRSEQIRCGFALPEGGRSPRPRANTAPKAKRNSPEREIQVAIIAYLRRELTGGAFAFALENERAARSADPLAAARFQMARQRNGIVPGMPDIGIAVPGGHVVWVEVKAPKGSVSTAQGGVHARLRAIQHPVAVVRSVDDVRLVLLQAGIETREGGQ